MLKGDWGGGGEKPVSILCITAASPEQATDQNEDIKCQGIVISPTEMVYSPWMNDTGICV